MYKGFIEGNSEQINYLFDNSDSVEYLSYSNIPNNITNICDLNHSKLKPFIQAFISTKKGSNFGMEGIIFSFKATQGIREFFLNNVDKNVSLSGFLYLDDENRYLENPAYLKNGILQYGYCSHEGYVDGDKKIIAEMDKAYIRGAKKDELYKYFLDKEAELPLHIYKQKKQLLQVFRDLENYIAEERNDFIFSCPEFECNIDRFKKCASYIFSDDILIKIENCKSYIEINDIFYLISEKYFAELYYWQLVKTFRKN